MVEIERKFLITSKNFIEKSHTKYEIAQGYLNSNPERTVRIRLRDKQGFITIKGKSNQEGTTRFEWEKEINYIEAQQLLALCEEYVISKTRYLVTEGQHTFEVDIFHGDNDGLIIAEIELTDANEMFEKPEWLGEEITNQKQYYNSYIATTPFKDW
ncbi:MAG: CYTH domain-containing protein [Flavobacteriaceae bacterium]|jgi:CYTH domain-containing protein|nr:CYTH domain-containing protein [Flavobacteriaceae bacterium]